MAIEKTIVNSGDLTTTSGDGKITINQTTGEIIIRAGAKRTVQIDETGFSYFDSNNIKRITIGQSEEGLEQIIVYGSNGKAQILVGQDPADETPVIAVAAAASYDVREELLDNGEFYG